MWVVVERGEPKVAALFAAPELACVYDLCSTDREGVAIRVGSFTDKSTALRVTELLNRHGMVDVPIPEGLS